VKEKAKKHLKKRKRPALTAGRLLSAVMCFQVICFLRLILSESVYEAPIALFGIGAFMIFEVVYYYLVKRFLGGGGVLEISAFFLSGVGLFALAGTSPSAVLWQLFAFFIGICFYVVFTLFLSDLDRVMKYKKWIIAASLFLLVLNLTLGKVIGGSQNWIRIGPLSMQPSEFVKIAFILVGSTTLERMQSSNHLTWFIVFFGICMGSLAWMGDLGTACVFFATFLVLCFIRSGRLGTIILMCSGAVVGGGAMLVAKPYIARRFSVWRHVWSDPNGLGYQQTRTLIAIASGGLLGLGPGKGYLKDVPAANTDLMFGLVSEEWGFLLATLVLLIYIGWVVLAIRGASAAKSSFYAIAAVSAACLLLFQAGLNVFGVTDIIPLTGITLPFVSRGGSSMIASWGLLAFLNFVPRLGEED
jgi:hypothetical protein